MIHAYTVDGWAVHLTPRVHAADAAHRAAFGFVWWLPRDPSGHRFIANDRAQALKAAAIRIGELRLAADLEQEQIVEEQLKRMAERIRASRDAALEAR